MATLDPTTQKSVRILISRAQCALHEANMFNEITSFIDSDIELPDEVPPPSSEMHRWLYPMPPSNTLKKRHWVSSTRT